jgi:hypothetical protein
MIDEQEILSEQENLARLASEEECNKRNARNIFWIMVVLFGAAILVTFIEKFYGNR